MRLVMVGTILNASLNPLTLPYYQLATSDQASSGQSSPSQSTDVWGRLLLDEDGEWVAEEPGPQLS